MAVETEINGSSDSSYLHLIHPGMMTSTLFSAIMLAYWDNVMGPVVSKVWLGNQKVEINKEIINYVSNHTLSGELCRESEKNTLDPKLYILSDLGYIFFSVVFNGNSSVGFTVSSLSFIMAYSELDRYLLLQDFVGKQVKLLVLKYRVLQQKDLGSAVKLLAVHLKSLINMIDKIEELTLHQHVCVNETVFGEIDEANDAKLLDSKFLMRSITSHLQTCGCTIVCGQSHERINMFIKTLSFFLSSSERYCSIYASRDKKSVYIQDLFLQGLSKNGLEDLYIDSISSKDIFLSSYPVSLIDIDKKTVLQTSQLNEHGSIRKEFLKVFLSMTLQGVDVPIYSYMNAFTDNVGDISIMVQQFITDLYALPNKCSIRKTHIMNFMETLKQKSLSLLAYAESHEKNTLDQSRIQQMKQDLSLASESDFRIVLAFAEKCHPGLALFVGGDRYKEDVKYKKQVAPTMWR